MLSAIKCGMLMYAFHTWNYYVYFSNLAEEESDDGRWSRSGSSKNFLCIYDNKGNWN